MRTNQFYSSGKSAYTSQLEKDFFAQKKEIQESEKISEKDKIAKITRLEKSILRKKRRADYFNF